MKIDVSLFDKQAFRLWIESKPPGAIVGHAGQCYLCPLAMWLRTLGTFGVEVGSQEVVIRDYSFAIFCSRTHVLPLPLWASTFVMIADNDAKEKRLAGVLNSDEITRERALQILDSYFFGDVEEGEILNSYFPEDGERGNDDASRKNA